MIARPSAQKNRLRRVVRALVIGIVILILLLAVEEVEFFARVPNVCSTGGNGMWIRHTWIGQKHSPSEYRVLAARLRRMRITDVYVHTGPIRTDGTVDSRTFITAPEFLRAMRQYAPKVRIQVWLGQIAAFDGGSLDITPPIVRKSIIGTGEKLLSIGFDGIHYDIEPIHSGNREFLALLKETSKMTRRHHAVLSIATAGPEQFPGLAKIEETLAANSGLWTRDYYMQVAHHVDQIAIMTYDSGIPLPGLYGRSIEYIVNLSARNGIKDLMIGVPTYDGTASHMAHAENVRSAITGLRRGISSLPLSKRKHVGAAIFAEWTTAPAEEKQYRSIWLKTR